MGIGIGYYPEASGLGWTPSQLANNAANYDASDLSSMRNNAGAIPSNGEGIKLWADKSGNSSTNVLCLNGVAGNYASFAALTAFGTGNFSVSAKVRLSSPIGTANPRVFGSNVNGFDLAVLTADGTLRTAKTSVGNGTPSTGAVTAWLETVVGYTRSGTTGVYYINGVAAGTVTDSNDYSTGILRVGSDISGSSPLSGIVAWARVYTAALTAPEMLADAGGTVQANCSFNEDFSTAAKLATSVTASTGQTVTINTSGATGARISGARDLVQMTAANQPILTIAAAGNYLTFDGSNDYLKAAAFALAQPETVYFVGSAVSWTSADYLFDGNTLNTMSLSQQTSTPNVAVYAGSFLSAITTWVLNTNAVITAVFNGASSANRLNRTTAITGNAGTATPNGITIGASGTPGGYANITAQEVVVRSVADGTTQQDAIIAYLGAKWNIAV